MKIKIIKTTTNDKEVAMSISNELVRLKFAPCVQVIPNLTSTYIYDKKLHNDSEYLILIKTSVKNISNCKDVIKKLHNYDVPEIIQLDAEILNDEYSEWFNENSN
jgi:periplasmic divalent cation tolerance protein